MSTEQGSDPVGDFQRWLMRAGAKSIGRDVAGRVRSTLGGGIGAGGGKNEDVWNTATTEVLTDEPPECQWCPICRAARRYRDSGGSGSGSGASGQFTSVGDTLAGLTRDAFSLFDAALRPPQRPAPPSAPSRAADSPPASSDHGTVAGAGAGVGWPAVVHPQHEDDETADERGDREEGGGTGDGGTGGGADEQVERTAE
jgi:hypothetical protein